MNTTKEIAMFSNYLIEGITAYFEDDLDLIRSLSSNLTCIPFTSIGTKINGPDFLIPIPNSTKIIAVEHFEFDSSKSIKGKGNLNRIELARIDREFKKIKLEPNQKTLHRNDSIKCKYSGEDYIINFKRVLDSHTSNGKEYISNVLKVFPDKSEDDIILVFMIMDTTSLGSYYITDNGYIPFPFLQTKEFREMDFSNSSIAGFFAGFHNYSTSQIIYCSTKNLEAFKSISPEVDFDKTPYFTFPTPQVSSFVTVLE